MFTHTLKHAVASLAAVGTTLVLFHAVVSVADHDRAALLAAQIKPTTLAAAGTETRHR